MSELVLPKIYSADPPVQNGKWLKNYNVKAYHSDREAVSQGALKHVLRSPSHFLDQWAKPYVEDDKSEILRMGTLVHECLLEHDTYGARVVRPEFGDQRYTENKEKKAAWMKGCPPGTPWLTEDEKGRCEQIAAGILRIGEMREALQHAEALREVTVFWVDTETRVWCRARLDLVLVFEGTIYDVKTTEDASAAEASRSLYNNDYHFQAAQYVTAASSTGMKVNGYKLCFAERNAPYEAALYPLSPSALARGLAERERAMKILRTCLDKNEWPGYPDASPDLDLPPYAYANRKTEDF